MSFGWLKGGRMAAINSIGIWRKRSSQSRDSQLSTLLPADDGADPPVEPAIAFENQGEFPSLTDQGEALPGPSYEAEIATNNPR